MEKEDGWNIFAKTTLCWSLVKWHKFVGHLLQTILTVTENRENLRVRNVGSHDVTELLSMFPPSSFSLSHPVLPPSRFLFHVFVPLHSWDTWHIASVSLREPLLHLLIASEVPRSSLCSSSAASSSSLLPCGVERGDSTWEAHLGYSCAAAIADCACGRTGCQCVFSHADTCVSVCGRVFVCSSHLLFTLSLSRLALLPLLSFFFSHSASFTGSLLHDNVSPPRESWDRSNKPGKSNVCVLIAAVSHVRPRVHVFACVGDGGNPCFAVC